MRLFKKIAFAALALVMILPVFAACSKKEPAYEGEANISYELGEEMIINIKGEQKKLLKCMVTLELTDSKLVATLDEKKYRVLDIIIECVRGQTLEQLMSEDVTVLLRQEIVTRINTEFNSEQVANAYFTTFVFN